MRYSTTQAFALVALRITIGWHFLYEGGVKVLNPNWTAKAYLLDSGGFLKGFFDQMAGNQSLLSLLNSVNAWGLTLIGFSLLVGIYTHYSSLAGMAMLLLYYLSHPAFPGIEYLFPADGSYFIINKTLIELFALLVILTFPTSRIFGLQRLMIRRKNIDI
jgi:thiosulfate dehydrogenase [quinone] large subunit